MKKILFYSVICLLVFSTQSYSQERESLFKGKVSSGGFGGPEMRISELDGESNALMGGKGAWLINHEYYLGGAGFGSINTLGTENYDFGYGGIMLGYIMKPQNIINFSAEIIAGAGGLSKRTDIGDDDADVLWVIEPAIYAGLNLTDFAKVTVGLSYRSVHGSGTVGISNSDLSGISANIALMFGKF